MKEVLTFLTACAVLAIANAFTTALAVALLFAALLGVVAYPRRVLGLAAALGLMALALKEPLACVGALAALDLAALVAAHFRRGRKQAIPTPTPPPLLIQNGHRP